MTLPLAMIMAVALPSCVPGLPGGADNDESNYIWSELIRRYPFPRLQPRPSYDITDVQVYDRPTSFSTEIEVYGIRDSKEQQKIIDILDDIRRKSKTKPILLTFYSNDRAYEGPNPNTKIRRVWVRDPKPFDVKPPWFILGS